MKYKFRAECLHDIKLLMGLVLVSQFKIESTLFPDCTAEITTELSIADLKKAMRKIPDSHVMLETIAPLNEYTGERRKEV